MSSVPSRSFVRSRPPPAGAASSSSRSTSSKRSSAQSRSSRAMTERRRQAHHRVVRLLRQHALRQQPLAHLARARQSGIDLGADPQAAAAHRLERRAAASRAAAPACARRARGCARPGPRPRCTFSASSPTAAASALPPKVEPCEPGVNTSITSRVPTKAETGSTPPPKRLAEDQPVGPHVLVLEGEPRAGAAEPRLDLVEDQQHVVLVAQPAAGRRASPPAAR